MAWKITRIWGSNKDKELEEAILWACIQPDIKAHSITPLEIITGFSHTPHIRVLHNKCLFPLLFSPRKGWYLLQWELVQDHRSARVLGSKWETYPLVRADSYRCCCCFSACSTWARLHCDLNTYTWDKLMGFRMNECDRRAGASCFLGFPSWGGGVSRLFFWRFLQQFIVVVACCLRMDEFGRRSKENPSLLYQSSWDLKKKKNA